MRRGGRAGSDGRLGSTHGARLADPEVLLDALWELRDVAHAHRRDVLGYATAALARRGAKAVRQTAVAPPSLLASI